MCCRRLPQYCSDCGWISGVALVCTLASIRPALRGFTCVRCCSLSPASFPRALTGTSLHIYHAVAFDSQLPPTGSVRDLHPQSIIHVQRTHSAAARQEASLRFVPRQPNPQKKEQHQENSRSSLPASFSPFCSLIKSTKTVSEMLARRGLPERVLV